MEHFSRSRCRKKIPAAGQPESNVHKRCLIYLTIHLVLKVWKMRRWMIPIPYKIVGKWSLHSLLKIIIKDLDHFPNNQEQPFNNPWNHHLTTPFAISKIPPHLAQRCRSQGMVPANQSHGGLLGSFRPKKNRWIHSANSLPMLYWTLWFIKPHGKKTT